MAEVYKIVRGCGAGGFMSPPGDSRHMYSIQSYSSNRSNARMTGSYAIDTDAEWIPVSVRERARKILTETSVTESELWIRYVYGYFKNSWTSNGQPWDNVDGLTFARPADAPLDWHAAVVHIRKWFPTHQPRAELIASPGKGYGSHPCDRCGECVQYEAHLDALAVVSTSMSGSGITQWSYVTECSAGGHHIVSD